jgi:hypothetical protein
MPQQPGRLVLYRQLPHTGRQSSGEQGFYELHGGEKSKGLLI